MQNFRILNSPKDTQNFRLEEHIPHTSNVSLNPRVQEISSFKDLVLFSGSRSEPFTVDRHISGRLAGAYADAYYRQVNRGWKLYFSRQWKSGKKGYTRPWAPSSVKFLLHPDSLRALRAVFWKYGYITLYPWQKTLLRNRKRRSHHSRSEEIGKD